LAEERCARLELAEVIDDMRRGQEPRGGWPILPSVRRYCRKILDHGWSQKVLERVIVIGLET
ncbi:hypothetical protein Tco_0198227, partial [Tanacetum coccineum]